MVCFSFAFLLPLNQSYAIADELENEVTETETKPNNYSIFIHSPSYSVFYDNKIYFVDEYDNFLKVFNTVNNEFSTTYIDLSNLDEDFDSIEKGTIIDASFSERFMLLLSKNETSTTITIVSVKDFEIVGQIKDSSFTTDYSKVSAKVINNEISIALTPRKVTDDVLPLVIFANISEISGPIEVEDEEQGSTTVTKEKVSLSQIYKIKLQGNDNIKDSLIKMLVFENPSNGYYLVFIYKKMIDTSLVNTITYSNVVSKESFNSPITGITTLGDDSILDDGIVTANIMEFNNNTYFLITHSQTDDETTTSYSSLYRFDVDKTSEDKIVNTGVKFNNSDNPYILTNGTYATYSDQTNQNITYVNITNIDENQFNQSFAENPKIDIDYKPESEFIYQTTNSTTEIYERPWSAKPLAELPENTDVVFIGEGTINNSQSHKIVIEDFNYCLYTIDGVNYLGYIKTTDLTNKTIIDVEDFPYPVFKVVPDTNLYSLPTNVTGDQITNTLTSSVIEKIRDNSRIEILNVICEYTTNYITNSNDGSISGLVMLKVRVNGKSEGYIVASTIIAPSETVNFVITNCSVKEKGTNVYIDPDKNSTIIYVLDKDYRVRINGERNTKTGYTYITFNDEYGNEFSGYIITDYLVTDSWTTLQIIGLVFIAITLGLLILILYFRRKKIGDDGQLYEKSKKENYDKKDFFDEPSDKNLEKSENDN